MKLSELVEGFPEKKNFLEFPANFEYCSGYNQALTACDKEVMVDEDYIQSEFDKLPNYDDKIPDEMWVMINRCVINDDKETMTRIMRISTKMTQKECKEAIAQNIKGIIKEVATADDNHTKRIRND